MATIDVPPEMAPFVRRLNTDPNDYEANKAIASFLCYQAETLPQSIEFFARALSQNRTNDPDHKPMLESFSRALIYIGDFAEAIKPLRLLLTLYDPDLKYLYHLAQASFRTGQVDIVNDAAKEIVERFYAFAEKLAERSGEPLTQILMPSNILQSHYGELAAKLDLYAKAKILGLTPDVRTLLPVLEDEVVNRCLYVSLRHSISDVIEFPSSAEERDSWEERHPRCLVSADYYVDPDGRGLEMNQFYVLVQRKWEESGRGPLVKLPDKYIDAGWGLLRNRGLPEDGWFVSIHARCGGFRPDSVTSGLTYHRNSRIENYLPAIKAIRERGGWVVRLGDSSMPPLPEMEGVIDYAHADWREDWIDVFFLAQNRFFVGVPSGPNAVAQMFQVPMVCVNWFPFEDWPAPSRTIVIFKRYCRTDDGSGLTVEEMANPPVRGLFSKDAFDSKGIEVIENSPEEILDAVTEMMDRCDGLIEYTAEDENLQQRFRAAGDPFKVGVNIRIGRSFLNRHRSLLG